MNIVKLFSCFKLQLCDHSNSKAAHAVLFHHVLARLEVSKGDVQHIKDLKAAIHIFVSSPHMTLLTALDSRDIHLWILQCIGSAVPCINLNAFVVAEQAKKTASDESANID
jgi:hypothetical protein